MNLDELRQRIDALDAQIVQLLNERAQCAMKIGEIKRSTSAAFYVPERERAVFDRLKEQNIGPMPDQAIKAIYRELARRADREEREPPMSPDDVECIPSPSSVGSEQHMLQWVIERAIGEILEDSKTDGLDRLLLGLANGSLTHEEVFDDHGHGALIFDPKPLSLDAGSFGVAVTGPRRFMMVDSTLRPYFAVPFGDMMIAGCFGLLVAVADLLPDLADPIQDALDGANANTTPWDAE